MHQTVAPNKYCPLLLALQFHETILPFRGPHSVLPPQQRLTKIAKSAQGRCNWKQQQDLPIPVKYAESANLAESGESPTVEGGNGRTEVMAKNDARQTAKTCYINILYMIST